MIHYPSEKVIVRFGDMELSANAGELMLHYLKGVADGYGPKAPCSSASPRIGSMWPGQGGIYAGVMRGRDGAPDYHLIVGPAIDKGTWEEVKTKAAALAVGDRNDFTLPFRAEQSLQFANVPELFEKEWYWSNEQRASDSDYAWIQDFYGGYQDNILKNNCFRARAVRRLVIL